MKILRAYKTELDLNNKQRTACDQHAGAARYAFNWGLNLKKQAMDKKEKIPNAIELHRKLNELKKTELGWMYQSSKCSPQEALSCGEVHDRDYNASMNLKQVAVSSTETLNAYREDSPLAAAQAVVKRPR